MSVESYKEFHKKARWGDLGACQSGIVSADQADSVDPGNGNRCIHIAAQNGHDAVVQHLIDIKADMDAQNDGGQTALHMAVGFGLRPAAEVLLASGANRQLVNGDGCIAESGIEGDYGVPALIGVASSEQQLLDAFAMAASHPDNMDKAKFASTGMKKKREAKAIWSPEVHAAFVGTMGDLP